MSQQFGFHIRLEVDTATDTLTLTYPEFEIQFTSDFDDQPTPMETTIDIYNLSPSTMNRVATGQAVRLQAGFTGDVGLLTKGTITHVAPALQDGGDEKFSIIMQEGTDYGDENSQWGKLDIDTTFAAGTSARTILAQVAQQAGINLQIISLTNEPSYAEGYSASGKPIDVLQEVAEYTGSKLMYRNGQLVIMNMKVGDFDAFDLNTDSGLLTMPTREEDYDWKGYSFDSIFNHRLTTAAIINLKSRHVNGTFRVISGEHTFDGTEAKSTLEVLE
ncbi:phage protein [Furfurilactobacillus sp. WILCCON 0119]